MLYHVLKWLFVLEKLPEKIAIRNLSEWLNELNQLFIDGIYFKKAFVRRKNKVIRIEVINWIESAKMFLTSTMSLKRTLMVTVSQGMIFQFFTLRQ